MYKWKVMLVIHQQWFMIKNLIITGENELNEKTVMNSNKIFMKHPSGNQGTCYLKARFQFLTFPVFRDTDRHRSGAIITIESVLFIWGSLPDYWMWVKGGQKYWKQASAGPHWTFVKDTLLQRGHAGIAPLKELLVFTLNNSGVQWEAWTKNFKVKFKPHARDELTYILASIPKQKWINPGNGKLHQMNSNPAEFATTEPREAGSDMWALSAHSGSTYLVSPAETLPILG